MTVGYDKPLYILPFDHRGSFQTKMFGWKGTLTAEQTEPVAAAKQVVYDGFKAAIAVGVPKEKAGILVDEQFGSAILRDARANGYTIACPAEKSGQEGELVIHTSGGVPQPRQRMIGENVTPVERVELDQQTAE